MARYLLILLLMLCCALTGNAQPAPNFTITDSQGQPHALYDDYLNQGKTVVLKLFFTSCPPCNAIAGATEQLYQDWGGGNHDVAFLSLSILSTDNNSAVNAYKANHGLTYPGAGATGGSLSAVAPYQDGTYGLFLGTPTFVVIAPNGTVNFDPRGGNQQATIQEVDAAIEATGAQRPLAGLSASGSAVDLAEEGIANAQIRLSELDSAVAATNSSGGFSFSTLVQPGQSYTLTAEKDVNPTNGVSTLDLILISMHILGVDTLSSPEQRLAADANRSGSISLLDQIRLRKLILGIDTELGDQPSWIFVRSGYSFNDPLQPFDEVYQGAAGEVTIVPGVLNTPQWRGIKVGDVNGDADPRH